MRIGVEEPAFHSRIAAKFVSPPRQRWVICDEVSERRRRGTNIHTHPLLSSSSEYRVPLQTTPRCLAACAIDLSSVNAISSALIG